MPISTTFEMRPPSRARLAGGPQQLLEDLAAVEVAAEAHRARRAERAGQRAARLRRDADRAPVAVAHQHRLDREAVGRAEPGLHRLVRRALLVVERQVGERQLAGEARADGLRERRHLVPRGRQVTRHTLPDLLSPIGWLAPISEQRHCLFELHESKGIHDSRPGRRRLSRGPLSGLRSDPRRDGAAGRGRGRADRAARRRPDAGPAGARRRGAPRDRVRHGDRRLDAAPGAGRRRRRARRHASTSIPTGRRPPAPTWSGPGWPTASTCACSRRWTG